MNVKVKKNRNKIKNGNSIVTVILYAITAILALITVYPMYYVLIQSVSDARSVLAGGIYLFPKGFNLSSYEVILGDSSLWRAYANTLLYVVTITVLDLLTSTTLAYGLSYKKLIGKKILTMFLLIPMYFGGGVIPSFLLMLKLGLYENPLAIIIPAGYSIWHTILIRSYFRTVPDGLSEAARIDGAGVVQILVKIFVPICKPIFAVVAVYNIVWVWNSWFSASIYLPHKDWQPLQMYLRRILVENTAKPTVGMGIDAAREVAERAISFAQLKYAMIIFTTLPVLCTYPFFQKYFVKGMVLGSLKE